MALLIPAQAGAITLTNVEDSSEKVVSDRVVRIQGEITPETLEKFTKDLNETKDFAGDRVVLIDSIGGSVDSGAEMLKLLEKERKAGHRIVCVVERVAYSMAFNILSQCDLRLATPKALLLFHRVSMDLPPRRRYTAPVLRRIVEELEKSDEPYRHANSKALGMRLTEYDQFADQEVYWRAESLRKRGYLHQLVYIAR